MTVSFDNYMQHDAHEFLNYLLNTVADLLQGNTILLKNASFKLVVHVIIIMQSLLNMLRIVIN